MERTRRFGRSPWRAVKAVVFACAAARSGDCLPATGEAEVDVTVRRAARIPPGTVIADRPPKGWTSLIIKSHPRVGAETLSQVSTTTARLAGLLFSAILADVQAERQPRPSARFYLAKVAVGVGTKVGGRDMIVSSDTQEKLGAKLGFLDRTVLSGGERQLDEIQCVARSRTMAILDAPSVLLWGKKHRLVVLRYALLVDPQTGQMSTLLWLLEKRDGKYSGPVGPMQWLPPNKVQDCVLHVDADEFFWGMPTAKAFAMARMPRGRQTLTFPEKLKYAAAQARLTPALARNLEAQLRLLIR